MEKVSDENSMEHRALVGSSFAIALSTRKVTAKAPQFVVVSFSAIFRNALTVAFLVFTEKARGARVRVSHQKRNKSELKRETCISSPNYELRPCSKVSSALS